MTSTYFILAAAIWDRFARRRISMRQRDYALYALRLTHNIPQ
jgi:hypothetical protein